MRHPSGWCAEDFPALRPGLGPEALAPSFDLRTPPLPGQEDAGGYQGSGFTLPGEDHEPMCGCTECSAKEHVYRSIFLPVERLYVSDRRHAARERRTEIRVNRHYYGKQLPSGHSPLRTVYHVGTETLEHVEAPWQLSTNVNNYLDYPKAVSTAFNVISRYTASDVSPEPGMRAGEPQYCGVCKRLTFDDEDHFFRHCDWCWRMMHYDSAEDRKSVV